MKKRNILISVSGPTAIGKTAWAIRLAIHFRTEILSADSRQFYREMRIGTAYPEPEELAAVPHHFIGHKSVTEAYSVGQYRDDALARLTDLFRNHPVLILVGGSGLYRDAVVQGLDDFPEIPEAVRSGVREHYRTTGLPGLQAELADRDPEYYGTVDRENPHRLMRALEVARASGRPYSSFLGNRRPPDFFEHVPIGLEAPRETLYRRINRRVARMMEAGLEAEARSLYPQRHLNALQTVGYQEMFAYMDGAFDRETAIREIAKNTRRYAKRQGTWLRRHPDIRWFGYREDPEVVIRYLESRILEIQQHG